MRDEPTVSTVFGRRSSQRVTEDRQQQNQVISLNPLTRLLRNCLDVKGGTFWRRAVINAQMHYTIMKLLFKNTKQVSLSVLVLMGMFRAAGAAPSRTDINPALLYYQAYILPPDLAAADRDYLFNTEWRGQKLPEKFGDLITQYHKKKLAPVRQAAQATAPCDWGLDLRAGPGMLLPHLARNKGIAQACCLHAMWALQHGQSIEARDDLLGALALARNSSRDGTMISALVQISIENIVCSAVAENFFQLSSETLQQLAAGFESAPPRGTLAACIPTEKVIFLDWLIGQIQELQQQNPGDEAKVMTGIRALMTAVKGPQEGGQDAQPDWVEGAIKAGGSTADGVVKLLRAVEPHYERMAAIMAQPIGEFENQLELFDADVQRSPNPFVSETFTPMWGKARQKEFAILAELAMVRAAVEYRLHGEAGLRSVADPCGQGPFTLARFSFQGVDRGFVLKSAYAKRGFQEMLIFVEKDGPPFQVNGKNAGQAPQESSAAR